MRGHLKTIAALATLTVLAFLAVRAIWGESDEPLTPPRETVDAAMARAGYRPVAARPDWVNAIRQVDAVYAHCPDGRRCEARYADSNHPLVALSDTALIAVAIGSAESSVVCFSLLRVAPPVTDPGWQAYARRVIDHAPDLVAVGPGPGPTAGPALELWRSNWRCVPRRGSGPGSP